jgi:hypothetical protein
MLMKASKLAVGAEHRRLHRKARGIPGRRAVELIETHDVVPVRRSRTNQSFAVFVSARPATMFVACVRNTSRVESGLNASPPTKFTVPNVPIALPSASTLMIWVVPCWRSRTNASGLLFVSVIPATRSVSVLVNRTKRPSGLMSSREPSA